MILAKIRRIRVKKYISLLLTLVICASPALAMDRAKVKVGPAKFKTKEGIVAGAQGEFINITAGGGASKGSGSITVLVPANFAPEKGQSFDLFSLAGEKAEDNPDALALGFSATKTKIKGATNVSSISYAEAAETDTTGKLKVKSYDPETKVLKFTIKAKASPFTVNKGDGNETVEKALKIKALVVVTLP